MVRRLESELYREERLQPLLEEMAASRSGLVRTWLHRRLRLFFSDFDVNAWLGMYPMTYLSSEEWREILPARGGRLVDVGAGSGDLTRALAPLFDEVICTETSRGMARRLSAQGFSVRRLDLGEEPAADLAGADALALLHVLDRCRAPLSLFGRALELVRPGGLVMVALPLPFAPHVDEGRRSVDPAEPLLPTGLAPDEARAELERRLFASRGLELLVTAKVPYLCPGDLEAPHYLLDSHLFVAKKR